MKKCILGISSLILNEQEKELIKNFQPYGIILFKRNCADQLQLKKLNQQIKFLAPEVKIFIDQEGGRVARLKAPNFIEFPAAASFASSEQVYDNYYKMGKYLAEFEIDVNCAPVADLLYPQGHNIIGDRSFGSNINKVVEFAAAAANGLLDAKIIPVIKHIPGHGLATLDSHESLPVINESLNILEETDFKIFKQLAEFPMAMTAHMIFTALDDKLPVTLSKKAINYIRETLNYKNILISDDLNMKALSGNVEDLACDALNAGCNYVLHCNGNLNEMEKILQKI